MLLSQTIEEIAIKQEDKVIFCPYKVNITRSYEIFSLISMLGDFQRAKKEYQKLVRFNQSYLNCQHCGLCESVHQLNSPREDFLENLHHLLYSD